MLRMKAVVERDKNHASVILWSLGNESEYGVHSPGRVCH
jgi:beta-galactosidase/beta-glucuronidase